MRRTTSCALFLVRLTLRVPCDGLRRRGGTARHLVLLVRGSPRSVSVDGDLRIEIERLTSNFHMKQTRVAPFVFLSWNLK